MYMVIVPAEKLKYFLEMLSAQLIENYHKHNSFIFQKEKSKATERCTPHTLMDLL